MRRKFTIIAILATLSIAWPVGAAQETVNYASVSGRVLDPQGGVIPGAVVTARHIDTNSTRETATDQEGRFRFPYLRVGTYEILVHQDGFTDTKRMLTLNVGAAFEMPVTLAVGGLDESVTVTGQATVIETARSQIAGTISQAEVERVPMNGRNFLDLALLVPGVSPTNTGSNQLFAETSAVPGQGISVGSQRNFSNNFIVDGLSANDDAAGLSGMPYGVDAVDQFQVVTSGGQAELGRALGGYVNVVTKSGTNSHARHALRLLPRRQLQRGQRAVGHDAADVTEAVRREPRRSDQPDRTFFFTNVEQRNLDQTGLTTIADRQRRRHQRAAGGGGLSRVAGRDRASIRTPST